VKDTPKEEANSEKEKPKQDVDELGFSKAKNSLMNMMKKTGDSNPSTGAAPKKRMNLLGNRNLL